MWHSKFYFRSVGRRRICLEPLKSDMRFTISLSGRCYSLLHLAGSGIDHVADVTTLSARPRVHILEAFELELSPGGGCLILRSNGIVSMDLCVRHSDTDWTLAL